MVISFNTKLLSKLNQPNKVGFFWYKQIRMFKYLSIFIFIFSFFKSFSQNEKKNIFSLKPFAGLNACQIHGDNFSGYKKLGVTGGIILNTTLNKRASIDLGFTFSQKGSRKNQNQEKNDFTFYRVNLNYIEIPLLLNYKLNEKYFATLGPSLAYLINYTEDTEIGNWNDVYPFNKFEYGVNVGLGTTIKNKVDIEVRSANSFLPIRNYGVIANKVFFPNAVARFFNKGLYNNVLSVLLIYKIKPKPKSEPKQ